MNSFHCYILIIQLSNILPAPSLTYQERLVKLQLARLRRYNPQDYHQANPSEPSNAHFPNSDINNPQAPIPQCQTPTRPILCRLIPFKPFAAPHPTSLPPPPPPPPLSHPPPPPPQPPPPPSHAPPAHSPTSPAVAPDTDNPPPHPPPHAPSPPPAPPAPSP